MISCPRFVLSSENYVIGIYRKQVVLELGYRLFNHHVISAVARPEVLEAYKLRAEVHGLVVYLDKAHIVAYHERIVLVRAVVVYRDKIVVRIGGVVKSRFCTDLRREYYHSAVFVYRNEYRRCLRSLSRIRREAGRVAVLRKSCGVACHQVLFQNGKAVSQTVFLGLLYPLAADLHRVIGPDLNVYVSAAVERERLIDLHRDVVSVDLSVTLCRVVGRCVILNYHVEFGNIPRYDYRELLDGGDISVCHLDLIAYRVYSLDKIDVSESVQALRNCLLGVNTFNSRGDYEARMVGILISRESERCKLFFGGS